jgi:hypothetical protein
MKTIEQLGLFLGDAVKVTVKTKAEKKPVASVMLCGPRAWNDDWSEWMRSAVDRVFRCPPEGIEPPLIKARDAACYV